MRYVFFLFFYHSPFHALLKDGKYFQQYEVPVCVCDKMVNLIIYHPYPPTHFKDWDRGASTKLKSA